MQQLITECIALLARPDADSLEIERIILILQSVIGQSEKNGTGDV